MTKFQEWCGRGHMEGITERELCLDAWNAALDAAKKAMNEHYGSDHYDSQLIALERLDALQESD